MFKKMKNKMSKIRVTKEKDRLLKKWTNLRKYLLNENVEQRDLLIKQEKFMRGYLKVLTERLNAWNKL